MREPNPKSENDWALPSSSHLLSVKDFQCHDVKLVKKKRGLFSVPIPPCRSLVALPRTPTLSFWNFNQIPFRWYVVFGKKDNRLRAFASRLGATHPCPIAVHTEPFSTSVFKDST